MVTQVSGFDDKVNFLGLVIETIEPPPPPGTYLFHHLKPIWGWGGGLIEKGELFDREGPI